MDPVPGVDGPGLHHLLQLQPKPQPAGDRGDVRRGRSPVRRRPRRLTGEYLGGRSTAGGLFLGTSLPDAPLFYANAQTLRDRLTELVPRAETPVHTVVLDLDANDSLDITTAETLAKVVDDPHGEHIRVGFAHAHSPVVEMLHRSGFLEALGAQRMFPNLTSALTWATPGRQTRTGRRAQAVVCHWVYRTPGAAMRSMLGVSIGPP